MTPRKQVKDMLWRQVKNKTEKQLVRQLTEYLHKKCLIELFDNCDRALWNAIYDIFQKE
jgi:hypothetical protein